MMNVVSPPQAKARSDPPGSVAGLTLQPVDYTHPIDNSIGLSL